MEIAEKRYAKGDRLFYSFNNGFLLLWLLIVLYPILYIIGASFSSTSAIMSGKVWLWPVDFSLEGYKAVFREKSVITGYLNTIFYTAAGTAISTFLTILAGYPLSRKDFKGRNIFMWLFTFTMIFNGGIIPMYLLVRGMGLLDSRLAILIPNAIWITNVIIARTYYQNTISPELLEAAQIDGCSNAQFFFRIVFPISKAITAVLVLYYAVGQWNAYFDAFLYLSKRELFPLQIILRDILVANQMNTNMLMDDPELQAARQGLAELLKFSLIIVASLPIWIVYPFAQKFFIKGVMIGSIKG